MTRRVKINEVKVSSAAKIEKKYINVVLAIMMQVLVKAEKSIYTQGHRHKGKLDLHLF